MGSLLIIFGSIGGLAVLTVLFYNRLIILENRVEEAWADIDVQLKRRANLIPNLVETVKGYADHEKGTLEKVTEARNMVQGAGSREERMKAENSLTSTLKTLFAVSENYPDLKASESFLELQKELRDAEDKIQAARRFYNTSVRDFNNKVEGFPGNLLASIFGFEEREFFEVKVSGEREVPKVEF